MAIGDIYCVKAFGSIYAQQMLNVYFYEQVATSFGNNAKGLWDAFDEEVLALWAPTVLNQTDIINVEVFAPATPSDFHDGVPANNQGLRAPVATERSPSYMAFGFKSNRAGPGTRSSFKRYAGLAEQDMDANSLSTSFTTDVDVIAFQGVLGDNISDVGGLGEYKPVQVKHPVPLGFVPVKNFDITAWGTAYLTSQVSRRPPAGT